MGVGGFDGALGKGASAKPPPPSQPPSGPTLRLVRRGPCPDASQREEPYETFEEDRRVPSPLPSPGIPSDPNDRGKDFSLAFDRLSFIPANQQLFYSSGIPPSPTDRRDDFTSGRYIGGGAPFTRPPSLPAPRGVLKAATHVSKGLLSPGEGFEGSTPSPSPPPIPASHCFPPPLHKHPL